MEAILEATARDTFGKNEARRTRRDGRVPAVMYGAVTGGGVADPTPIAVEPKALLRILHSDSGANTLISLKMDGNETKVLVKDYQLDPITHAILHADFYRVAMDRAIQVTIPVIIKGEPRGVKLQGGLLEFVRREIEIECLPADIPEHIDVDVTELMLHQGLRVRDVATNPKWNSLTDGDAMLVHIILPKAEESAASATAAAAPAATAEPEVMKKGKKEEEGKEEKKK
ncbi:MAG: 50S ribosomal protein L25 [Acidobacteriaceae bacterium]|jgi:large subunit ribosomal protein L25|nr:50S ribosomal protein L25 [Acidobacteriaceae bacterium]